MGEVYNIASLNKKAEDLDELYVFRADGKKDGAFTLDEKDYFLVNTSGRVVDKKGRSRDGNDYYFVTGNNGQIQAIYLEN